MANIALVSRHTVVTDEFDDEIRERKHAPVAVRGKCGGIYRYYRCTKKKGVCSQKYIQEKDLATQIKARLQSVALCDEWTDKMLKQVDEWEKENNHSSQKFVQNLKNKITETQEKLDKLVSAYIDGDIPKENYLPKKEELLKQKVSLANNLEDFG